MAMSAVPLPARGHFQVGAKRPDQVADGIGRPHRRRRFEDDEVARFQDGCDRPRRAQDMADVGGMIVVERRRNGDQEDIRHRNLGRCAQQAACDDPLHQRVEIDLVDVDLPGIDGIDDALVHVDTEHLRARSRNDGGGRQADIAEPHDADRGRNANRHGR
jgi:hypothetical protein